MTTAFGAWLASARPKETFCYHVGINIHVPECDRETIESVRRAYNEGRIELVQRLVQPRAARLSKYEHFAVKREVQSPPASRFTLTPAPDWRLGADAMRELRTAA